MPGYLDTSHSGGVTPSGIHSANRQARRTLRCKNQLFSGSLSLSEFHTYLLYCALALTGCSGIGSADPQGPTINCSDRCSKKAKSCGESDSVAMQAGASLCPKSTEGQLVCFEGLSCSQNFETCFASAPADGGTQPAADMASPAGPTLADCAGTYSITYKPSGTCGSLDLPSPETWVISVTSSSLSAVSADPNMKIDRLSPRIDKSTNRQIAASSTCNLQRKANKLL
jgi:hypothetical protein